MANQSNKEIVLICDIGGTNVRFGLYTEGQKDNVNFDGKYKCDEFTSFESAVLHYLEGKKLKPTLCVIGAAGNIDEYNGEVLTTNTPWKASVSKLKAKCPYFKHVRLVNDFALQGWALSELTSDQYRSIIKKDTPMTLTQGQVVIIGPGTGLGTCLILQDGKHPQTIYTSEAGHSTMPHVDFGNKADNEDNASLLRILKEYYATKGQTPITEHIVSGTGISNVYHAFKDGKIPTEKSERVPSEKIEELAKGNAEKGIKPDETALKTFKFFNAYLGAHAGSMAATTKTQKIFFCGGLMASDWVIKQLEESKDFKKQFVSRAGMTEAMKTVSFAASLYRDMATLGAVSRAKHLIETTKSEQEKRQANRDIISSLAILQEVINNMGSTEAIKYFRKVRNSIERYQDAQTREIHSSQTIYKKKHKNFRTIDGNVRL